MSELTKSWLTAELMRVKSGYADWACNPKTIWLQWSWERLGTLADWPAVVQRRPRGAGPLRGGLHRAEGA